MRLLAFSALAILTLTTAATTQSASFVTFGSACSTTHGTPGLSNVGLPVIGQQMDVRYSGPNNAGSTFTFHPHLVIGFSFLPQPVTIPDTLFPDQPMGCTLYARHHVVLPMPKTAIPNTYQDVFTFTIPNNAALAGMQFFPQWLTVYTQCGIVPPCWIGSIAASEVGIATIGF